MTASLLSVRFAPFDARALWLSLAMLALGACRAMPMRQALDAPSEPPMTCADGERAMQRDALYFGRSRRDGGTVNDAQWRAFVDDAIVPRFPDGFTALAAEGHWRAGDGAIVGEATQMVIVLHAGDADAQRAIEEIVAQYKREFAQESVLRERAPACVRF